MVSDIILLGSQPGTFLDWNLKSIIESVLLKFIFYTQMSMKQTQMLSHHAESTIWGLHIMVISA
jgi:hypothetical protein